MLVPAGCRVHVAGIPHAYHDPNTVRCLRVCAIIHFGTDGWRARVDEDFTADNVARIADAVGELWQKTNPGKTVYIGFDTRPLAREFAELAAGVLAAHGLDAVLASRPVPTPALTWAAAYDGEACGALMVTGSHHRRVICASRFAWVTARPPTRMSSKSSKRLWLPSNGDRGAISHRGYHS